MQSANQHGKSLRSQIIMIALRALLILFGVATVSGYGYGVFDHFKTNGAVFEIVVLSPVVISIPFALGWLINKEHPGHMIALLFLVMAYTMGAANISYGIHLLNEAHPGRYANQIDASTLTIGHIVWMPSVIFPLFLI